MGRFAITSLLAPVLGLAALPVLQLPAQAAAPTRSGTPVQVWLSDTSTDTWVERQADVAFQTKQTTNPLTIKVDDLSLIHI